MGSGGVVLGVEGRGEVVAQLRDWGGEWYWGLGLWECRQLEVSKFTTLYTPSES